MRLAIPAAVLLSAASAGAQAAPDSSLGVRSFIAGRVLGTVTADSIARAPVASLSQMLTARIPGVQTFTRDGQVGVGSVAYVRGLSGDPTFSEPLLYIDGVRADGRPAQHGPAPSPDLGSGGPSGSARLDDIDPSQIARVEVITGPAAALYGPGAQNGVILVTTTRSDGGPPRVDLSAEGGLTTMPLRDGQSYYAWGNGAQCLTYQRAQGQCTVDSITHFNPLLVDQSAVTGTGYLQRYVASVGGGLASNVLRYMVTGNYNDEIGTLQLPSSEQSYYQTQYGGTAPRNVQRPNAMDAAGVRGTMTGTFGSVADVSVSLGYLGNHQRSADDGALLESAAVSPGYAPPGGGWGDVAPRPSDIFADRTGDDVRRFTGSLHGDWRPVSLLTAFVTAGVDNVDETSTSDDVTPGSEFPGGLATTADDRQRTARSNVNGGVTIQGVLAPGVSSRTTIGGEYLEDHFIFRDSATANFAGSYSIFYDAAHARAQTGSGYLDEAVAVADRLFVNGGVRVDDMRIHPLLSSTATNGFVNAAFLPLPTTAPSLRLHAGYSTGSQAPSAEQAVTNVLRTLTVQLTGTGYYPVEGQGPSLTREQDIEAGVSAGAWHGRLSGDVTVYERRTARALLPVDIGIGSGQVTQVVDNSGVVRNRGIEGRVSAQLIDQPAYGWDASLSAFGNENRLLNYPYPLSLNNGLGLASGHPLYGVWAFPYTYRDANGDGAIAPNEVTVSSTPTYVGSAVPTREASLATGVRLFHHRLRVAALLDYRGGYVLPNEAGELRALVGYDAALNDLPSSLGRQAQAIAALVGGNNVAGWYQHVEAFRWRELSATVTVRRFDVTFATRNLALWTNYRGNDPDMDLTEGAGAYATTLRLPPPRAFLLKLATTI